MIERKSIRNDKVEPAVRDDLQIFFGKIHGVNTNWQHRLAIRNGSAVVIDPDRTANRLEFVFVTMKFEFCLDRFLLDIQQPCLDFELSGRKFSELCGINTVFIGGKQFSFTRNFQQQAKLFPALIQGAEQNGPHGNRAMFIGLQILKPDGIQDGFLFGCRNYRQIIPYSFFDPCLIFFLYDK